MFRLFIDEVGQDKLANAHKPDERYLFLLGVIMDMEYAQTDFTEQMNKVKRATFGQEDVILHKRELVAKSPAPYDVLQDPAVQSAFDEQLINLLSTAEYKVIAVLIDKKKHLERYDRWHFHPYHYCLTAMIERYVYWLEEHQSTGDVLAEARDKKQNMKLEDAYTFIFRNGTGFAGSTKFVHPERMQERLTSSQIKFKTKQSNVAGLQLADLLASPARRHILCKIERTELRSPFSKRIIDILIQQKYRRAPWGHCRVLGFGLKVLP